MSHNEVMEGFRERFPGSVRDIDVWFQNGKNSIRIRFKNKNEFVFTYYDKSNWALETAQHHLERKFDIR